MLRSKAPLFFDHFDWTPIGDSETIVVTFAQEASHPWPSIAGGEGKPQTVIEAIHRIGRRKTP
jgi:hypothetical protein